MPPNYSTLFLSRFAMPKNLTLDEFKQKSDKFLSSIPDEPHIGDQTPRASNIITAKPSNSIIDQVRMREDALTGG